MSAKNYLIAGASSGIGLELAKILISHGHNVIGLSRSPGELEQEAQYRFIKHDFSSDEKLPEIGESLEGLVYCPGSINLKPFNRFTEKDLDDDFRINAKGAFLLIKEYVSKLKTGENPSILLFSSVAVGTGFPYHSSIAMAKGAVEGLTRSLAAELAPAIRVNCIAPSLTDTPLASQMLASEEKKQANRDRHPLKNIGDTTDIAEMAALLLTNAKWITGQVIGINGGMGTVIK